jgi:hypothetical protein
MTKSTLSRWLTETVADTRTSDGPTSRLYAAPFAEVWDWLVDCCHRRRRWKLIHADEELGIMTIVCTTPVFRLCDDLTIWLSLDENGLTRVEARSESRIGKGDLGMNRRRLERLFSHLDRSVGPAVRG